MDPGKSAAVKAVPQTGSTAAVHPPAPCQPPACPRPVGCTACRVGRGGEGGGHTSNDTHAEVRAAADSLPAQPPTMHLQHQHIHVHRIAQSPAVSSLADPRPRPPPSPPVGPAVQQHALHRRHQRDAHGAGQAGRQRVVHPPADVAQQTVHLLQARQGRAEQGRGLAGQGQGGHICELWLAFRAGLKGAHACMHRAHKPAPHTTIPHNVVFQKCTQGAHLQHHPPFTRHPAHPAHTHRQLCFKKAHLQHQLQSGDLDVEAVQPLKQALTQLAVHQLQAGSTAGGAVQQAGGWAAAAEVCSAELALACRTLSCSLHAAGASWRCPPPSPAQPSPAPAHLDADEARQVVPRAPCRAPRPVKHPRHPVVGVGPLPRLGAARPPVVPPLHNHALQAPQAVQQVLRRVEAHHKAVVAQGHHPLLLLCRGGRGRAGGAARRQPARAGLRMRWEPRYAPNQGRKQVAAHPGRPIAVGASCTLPQMPLRAPQSLPPPIPPPVAPRGGSQLMEKASATLLFTCSAGQGRQGHGVRQAQAIGCLANKQGHAKSPVREQFISVAKSPFQAAASCPHPGELVGGGRARGRRRLLLLCGHRDFALVAGEGWAGRDDGVRGAHLLPHILTVPAGGGGDWVGGWVGGW